MSLYKGKNLISGNLTVVPIDSELSKTSENAVQNKVVAAAVGGK